MAAYRVVRSQSGRTWDVVDAQGAVVEGGFFAKSAAQAACAEFIAGTR